jgi:hypothetical protein
VAAAAPAAGRTSNVISVANTNIVAGGSVIDINPFRQRVNERC